MPVDGRVQNVQVPNQTVIILQVISSASDGLAAEKNNESDDEDLPIPKEK